jgi:hypothetical protein
MSKQQVQKSITQQLANKSPKYLYQRFYRRFYQRFHQRSTEISTVVSTEKPIKSTESVQSTTPASSPA